MSKEEDNFDFQMRKVPKNLDTMDPDDQIMMSAQRYVELMNLAQEMPKELNKEYKRGRRNGIIISIVFSIILNATGLALGYLVLG